MGLLQELVAICYSSWLPFLRCSALVLAAACSSDNATDPDTCVGGDGVESTTAPRPANGEAELKEREVSRTCGCEGLRVLRCFDARLFTCRCRADLEVGAKAAGGLLPLKKWGAEEREGRGHDSRAVLLLMSIVENRKGRLAVCVVVLSSYGHRRLS